MSYLSYLNTSDGLEGLFLRGAKRYFPFVQFLDGIMTGPSDLSRAQREAIARQVSQLNGCDYCADGHTCVIDALGADADTLCADAAFAAMLGFTAKLTREPAGVGKDDVAAVQGAGWTEQAIEDAVCVVSAFSFFNRMVDGLGIEGAPEGFREFGQMVGAHGYSPLVQMMREASQSKE